MAHLISAILLYVSFARRAAEYLALSIAVTDQAMGMPKKPSNKGNILVVARPVMALSQMYCSQKPIVVKGCMKNA